MTLSYINFLQNDTKHDFVGSHVNIIKRSQKCNYFEISQNYYIFAFFVYWQKLRRRPLGLSENLKRFPRGGASSTSETEREGWRGD